MTQMTPDINMMLWKPVRMITKYIVNQFVVTLFTQLIWYSRPTSTSYVESSLISTIMSYYIVVKWQIMTKLMCNVLCFLCVLVSVAELISQCKPLSSNIVRPMLLLNLQSNHCSLLVFHLELELKG